MNQILKEAKNCKNFPIVKREDIEKFDTKKD